MISEYAEDITLYKELKKLNKFRTGHSAYPGQTFKAPSAGLSFGQNIMMYAPRFTNTNTGPKTNIGSRRSVIKNLKIIFV